jgi:hypothetical protein
VLPRPPAGIHEPHGLYRTQRFAEVVLQASLHLGRQRNDDARVRYVRVVHVLRRRGPRRRRLGQPPLRDGRGAGAVREEVRGDVLDRRPGGGLDLGGGDAGAGGAGDEALDAPAREAHGGARLLHEAPQEGLQPGDASASDRVKWSKWREGVPHA